MNDPVEIKLTSLVFHKAGSLEITGTVNGEEIYHEITAENTEFDELCPELEVEYEYRDDDGLYNAVMDDYFNLHWSLKVEGFVMCRVVRLDTIAEQFLYDKYINQ